MSTSVKVALRASAVLWLIWGLVHILAGVMTLTQETGAAIAGIADAVDPALLAMDYHGAVGGVIKQHGFNLLWIGMVTALGSVAIWRRHVASIFVVAMVGGLADVGYFLFIDLGGYNHFVPGTIMTFISASAIITSLYAYFSDPAHLSSASGA